MTLSTILVTGSQRRLEVMVRAFSDEEKEVIRQAVVQAAERLFTEQGFSKTTISEIARTAGIGKGTFYLFFKSKEEVVWALHDAMHHRFHDELTEILGGISTNPLEAIPAFLRAVFGIFNDPLVVKLQQTGDFARLARAMTHEQMEEHTAMSLDGMISLVVAAQRAGAIVEGDPAVIAGTIRSVCFIGLHREEIGEEIYPEVVDMVISLVAKGLTRKGEEQA